MIERKLRARQTAVADPANVGEMLGPVIAQQTGGSHTTRHIQSTSR
jgi:hypothetical protein